MYVKCDAIEKAPQMFDGRLSAFGTVAFITSVAVLSQCVYGGRSLYNFDQLYQCSVLPNAATFISSLKVCGNIGADSKGQQIHATIINNGLLTKSSLLQKALIDMYAKCGLFGNAAEVLDDFQLHDFASWNALIAGYAKHGYDEQVMIVSRRMQCVGLFPDGITYTCILKALSRMNDSKKYHAIHACFIESELLRKDSIVGNALVQMYGTCGALAKAQKAFNHLPEQNVVSWNVLISCYAQHEYNVKALACFDRMLLESCSPSMKTFVCLLKACESIESCGKGQRVHSVIIGANVLKNNCIVGNALINMYVKCGHLEEAWEAFDGLPIWNTVSWNALLTGIMEHGHHEEALISFQIMKYFQVIPDAVTFIIILKAISCVGLLDKGEEIYVQIQKDGLLQKDTVIGNVVVHMYAKCGAIAKAQHVFDALEVQSVVSWNVLIAGYVHAECFKIALDCFDQMQHGRISPDLVTFSSILKACGALGILGECQRIHTQIVKYGLLGKDVIVDNTLVDVYGKCDALTEAQGVFDCLRTRDKFSWNALIAGYVEHGYDKKVLSFLERMWLESSYPDVDSIICILKEYGRIRAQHKVKEFHARILIQSESEFRNDIIWTALVDTYAKCGILREAQDMFDKLMVWDVISWTLLILGYAENLRDVEVLNCLEQMQIVGVSPDALVFDCVLRACCNIAATSDGQKTHATIVAEGYLEDIGDSLLYMYAKFGMLVEAQDVFDELQAKDTVSWNILITGYCRHGQCEEALKYFNQMQRCGVLPDAFTYCQILKTYGIIGDLHGGQRTHAQNVGGEILESDLFPCNVLVDMYARAGAIEKAQEILDKIQIQDEVSWNALIKGYIEHQHANEVLNCFGRMQVQGNLPNKVTYANVLRACGDLGAVDKCCETHARIYGAEFRRKDDTLNFPLVSMYAMCGLLREAQGVVDESSVQDVTSWTMLITGYVQQKQEEKAIVCFQEMQARGSVPDAVILVCMLKACGSTGAADMGQSLHGIIVKAGHSEKYDVVNALIDMYSRCCKLKEVHQLFEKSSIQDVISWNILIGSYAQLGEHEIVFQLLNTMISRGCKPDLVTFHVVLNACSHSGRVEESHSLLQTMKSDYDTLPTLEHHTCLIDLFGRVGSLEGVAVIITNMPCSADQVVWHIVSDACKRWGDVKLARLAFEHALQLDATDCAAYIIVRNIITLGENNPLAGSPIL